MTTGRTWSISRTRSARAVGLRSPTTSEPNRRNRKQIVRNPFYRWRMDIILISGLWLTSDVWSDVVDELQARGHDPRVVALPGADDGDTQATLTAQLDAVLAAVDAAPGAVTVVGHSAASTVAWLAADRRPEGVRQVVMIGGFPVGDGSTYADLFPLADGAMPFPGWETFAGPIPTISTNRRLAGSQAPPLRSRKALRSNGSSWVTSAASTFRSCSSAPSSARTTRKRDRTRRRCRTRPRSACVVRRHRLRTLADVDATRRAGTPSRHDRSFRGRLNG